MIDPKRGKLKIILQIIAFKASCDGFPKLNIRNSLPSLNKSLDVIQFIMDLIESLIGIERLKELLINMLSFELDKIENTIKNILKSLIKESFSCGISPTMPIDYITNGINIDIKRIDFFDTLKSDPSSEEGISIYGDPTTDFNYFLYETVQTPLKPNTWNNLLIVNYYPPTMPINVDGEIKYNVLNIKVHPNFINKPIFNFLNDFIDSVRFLPKQNTVPKIIDSIFGTLTSSLKKDFNTILNEVKFEKIVDNVISNGDREQVTEQVSVDNSFFTFSNEELFEIEQTATLRQSGNMILKECSNTPSTLPLSGLTEMASELKNSTSPSLTKEILTKQLTRLSELSSDELSDENKKLAQSIFFKNLIKGFIKVIAKAIVGPAISVALSIYFKMAYGKINYNNLIEFIKNNAQMYIDMIKKVVIETIQRILLNFLINALKEIIICNFIENNKQAIKQYQDSLESLVSKGQEKYLKLMKALSKLGISM